METETSSFKTNESDVDVPTGKSTQSTDKGDMGIGYINTLMHAQIDQYLAADAQAPLEYDNINLDELITNINPDLWKAVCLLTQSKSEIRGYSKVTDPHSSAFHIKKI